MLRLKCKLIEETDSHSLWREGWYLFGFIPWSVRNRKIMKFI